MNTPRNRKTSDISLSGPVLWVLDGVKFSRVAAEVIGAAVGGWRVVVESITIHALKRRGKGGSQGHIKSSRG